MPFPALTVEQFQTFFWILLRISIVLFFLPMFGARGLPTMWKVALSMVMAGVFSLAHSSPPPPTSNLTYFVLALGSELLLGIVLALGVRFLFASVQLAGQFLGFQMRFNMASVMDPQTGGRSSVMAQFLYLFMVLIFFSVDGHHIFIRALSYSFEVIPPGSFELSASIVGGLVKVSNQMFVLALKLAAPVMIGLFLSNLCLGIVARTVPQVNILMVGFPLNIGLGMILLGLTMSSLAPFFVSIVKSMGQVLMMILQWT